MSFSGLFLCFKVNPDADRENKTVMAAVSAVGEKLPPGAQKFQKAVKYILGCSQNTSGWM